VIRAVAEGKDMRLTRAEEIMTTDIYSARPNDRVIDVIRKMGDKQVRRIPVLDDNNNLLGIISMADIALETEEDRELAEALEEISSGSSFWSKIFG
jgi:CBS domain-containing protein